MFAKFFIDRPVFTAVLFLVITLMSAVGGAAALLTLPVTEYPEPETAPAVEVSAVYPGANARVVADTVAAPIEQQVNGVEGMLSMSSQSTHDGGYTLTVTFRPGTDPNIAQVLVASRVSLAQPILPDLVIAKGITIKEKSPSVMIVNLFSPDNSRDSVFLSNYATLQIREELALLPGVRGITYLGRRDYSVRLWLDPQKLAAFQLSVEDVVAELRGQNVQVAAEPGQRFQFSLTTLGRLTEQELFADIILKNTGRSLVRLKDVANLEQGARSQHETCTLDGKPSVALVVYPLPGADALETAARVRARMGELKTRFPNGLDYDIVYDPTAFTVQSIGETINALRNAGILTAAGLLLFLLLGRSWLVPLLAVVVVMPVTFAVLAAVGCPLNNLTLLGLVLVLGLCVQDAAVLVEATAGHIGQGLAPRAAAVKAAAEVSHPVLAVALVLSAAFVPCLFAGIAGAFFRQFALVLAVAAVVSACTALTLCPALCAVLVGPSEGMRDPAPQPLGARVVRFALRGTVVLLALYAGLLALTWWGCERLPTSDVPAQDRGELFVRVHLPDAPAKRIEDAVQRLEAIALKTPGVRRTLALTGHSTLLGPGVPNAGALYLVLDDFDHRAGPHLSCDAIAAALRERFREEVPGAAAHVFRAPPVKGLGKAGGFTLVLLDTGNNGPAALRQTAARLIAAAKADPHLPQLSSSFPADVRWLELTVDRARAREHGVSINDIRVTLEAALGPAHVNDFNGFGRTWQITVQARGKFRKGGEDVRLLEVRNDAGARVALGKVATVREVDGPALVTRHNLYEAVALHGSAPPGVSPGRAIEEMERLVRRELPATMHHEWTELPPWQSATGNTALLVLAAAVFGVFLVLAAQYESWSLPLAVILVIPMCLLGCLAGVAITRSDVNLFTQIGFVVLVGMASKNALFIIKFAKVKREQGLSREACRQLRPVLMTSCVVILGVLPLILGTGAGAEMRRALGVAVFSGMLGVTLFGIFLTPVFFLALNRLSEAAIFTTPAGRLTAKVLLWVFVALGFVAEGVVLFLSWWGGAISLRSAIALGFGLLALLAFFSISALLRALAPASGGAGHPADAQQIMELLPRQRPPGEDHVQKR